MLDDRPRKLLSIVYHFTRNHGRVQTVDELVRRLRWSSTQVLDELQVLSAGGFIAWDPAKHEQLVVLKASEMDWPQEKGKKYWECD